MLSAPRQHNTSRHERAAPLILGLLKRAAEAQTIGARMLVLEEELDGLFVSGDADTLRLAVLTAALGALGGRLREAHLAAHIGMRAALDPGQREAYARLRRYTAVP